MSWVLDRGGSILYKAMWTSAAHIGDFLEARAASPAGPASWTFYAEQLAPIVRDRDAFQRGLERNGPRAGTEFARAEQIWWKRLDAEALAGLAETVRGPVLTPGDPGYDEARAIWNGLIDRRPALIVQCSGAADVVDAVNFAREHGLVLSIKGGGHNVAGNAVNDGGLVIDLSQMRGVHVDPATQTVRVQGGATWGDCDRETQLFGLAVPGGVVSTTGIAGLTLHGGVGHCAASTGSRSTTCSRSTSSPPTGSSGGRARPRTRTCSGRFAAPAATSAS